MAILLDNVSVDTISETFKVRGSSHVAVIRGDDFGGGTVSVEVASPNDSIGRFSALVDGSFTESGQYKIDYLPSGSLIRAQLIGSTSPVNVFVDIDGVSSILSPPAPPLILPPFSSSLDSWFDASNLGTITSSGGLVSALADPRSNSRVMVQSNNSLKPQIGIETQNGLNVLTLSTTSQLVLNLSPELSNEEISVFAAVKDSDAAASTRAYFDVFDNSTGIGLSLTVSDSGGPTESASIRDHRPTVIQNFVDGGNLSDWNIAGGTRSKLDSHRLVSRINTFESTVLPPAFSDVLMNRMTIGSSRLESIVSASNIGEIVVYNKALSLSERDSVVQYLSNKWSIT